MERTLDAYEEYLIGMKKLESILAQVSINTPTVALTLLVGSINDG